MELKTVKKTNLVEQVQDQIVAYIKTNQLEIGDGLPSELELKEALGVSRSIVREALSRLRMVGLLDARKKRGMVVAEPDIFGACRGVLHVDLVKEKTIRDLFEIRLALEVGMADLMFLRQDPVTCQKLEQLIIQEQRTKNTKKLVALDVEFHATLYRMSGNAVLLDFQEILYPFFDAMVQKQDHGMPRGGSVSHADLLTTLKHGSAERFREATREHLDCYYPYI